MSNNAKLPAQFQLYMKSVELKEKIQKAKARNELLKKKENEHLGRIQDNCKFII
jgi:hypothetical protein